MDPLIASSLVGTGGGLISTLLNQFLPLSKRDLQAHQLSVDETMRQEQRQEDFYNQYQSIGAQVRQYKEAGLNPALMQSGASGVVSGPSSSPVAASPAPDPVSLILSLTQGIEALRQGKEAHDAEIENKQADTRLKNANAAGKEFQNLNAQELLDLDIQERNARIEAIFSGIDKDEADIALAEANTNLAETEARYKETLNAIAELEEQYKEPILQATVAKMNAETSYIQYKQELEDCYLLLENAKTEDERKLIEARVNLLEQQTKTAQEEARVAGELCDLRVREAKGSANYSAVRPVLESINTTAKAVGIIGGSFKAFGALGKLSRSGVKIGSKLRRTANKVGAGM